MEGTKITAREKVDWEKICNWILRLLNKSPMSRTQIVRVMRNEKPIFVKKWILDNPNKLRKGALGYLEDIEEVFRVKYSKENEKLLKKLFKVDWEIGTANNPHRYYYVLTKYTKKDKALLGLYKERAKRTQILGTFGIKGNRKNWLPPEKVREIIKKQREEEKIIPKLLKMYEQGKIKIKNKKRNKIKTKHS